MLRQQKGITLVALVITVIVLLILAGVAMSMITGDGGLFQKANDAAGKYNEGAQNEKNELDNYMNFMNEYYSKYANTTNTGA